MIGALVLVGAVAICVVAAWVAKRAKHPEQAAGEGQVPADTTSDRFYRTADRPAGPDAEDPPIA
ncbi:MAG: hypothetical protein R2702_16095 [Acidimicrobiales bacterium]